MSKQQYLEMCEMLGSEPLEEEIPTEISDFSSEIQVLFEIYGMLNDNWDGFGGNYLGKDNTNLFKLFEIYSIPEPDLVLYMQILKKIDSVRSELISQRQKQKQQLEKNSKKPA